MTDLILYPFSGIMRETISVIQTINKKMPTWNIIGFCDDNIALKGITYRNIPILGSTDELKKNPQAKVLACPTTPTNFRETLKNIHRLNLPRDRFASIIHPSVELGNQSLVGLNTLIMGGVHLTNEVTVGDHCTIMHNSVLHHEVTLGEGTYIGSNVSVGGGVNTDTNCYISNGSHIFKGLTLRQGTLVGLGSVVLYSTKEEASIAGNPAMTLPQKSSSDLEIAQPISMETKPSIL